MNIRNLGTPEEELEKIKQIYFTLEESIGEVETGALDWGCVSFRFSRFLVDDERNCIIEQLVEFVAPNLEGRAAQPNDGRKWAEVGRIGDDEVGVVVFTRQEVLYAGSTSKA